jgi:hypothetical protein
MEAPCIRTLGRLVALLIRLGPPRVGSRLRAAFVRTCAFARRLMRFVRFRAEGTPTLITAEVDLRSRRVGERVQLAVTIAAMSASQGRRCSLIEGDEC